MRPASVRESGIPAFSCISIQGPSATPQTCNLRIRRRLCDIPARDDIVFFFVDNDACRTTSGRAAPRQQPAANDDASSAMARDFADLCSLRAAGCARQARLADIRLSTKGDIDAFQQHAASDAAPEPARPRSTIQPAWRSRKRSSEGARRNGASWMAAACVGVAIAAPLSVCDALPAQGCPKAHCDAANSGFTNQPIPGANTHVVALDSYYIGEVSGLSQGPAAHRMAHSSCAVTPVTRTIFLLISPPRANTTTPTLSHTTISGARKWSSIDDLGPSAYTSAPLILGDGLTADTIAVDAFTAIKYDDHGAWVWKSPLNPGGPNNGYGGTPISPVITSNGWSFLRHPTGRYMPLTALSARFLQRSS